MGKSDLFARAAECERALHLATDADHRSTLRRLRTAWLRLATEEHTVHEPGTQETISVLKRLHSEIAAAQPTLH
jgi:hypothetical protein